MELHSISRWIPVILTLHQPESEVFAYFDEIMIITHGQLACHAGRAGVSTPTAGLMDWLQKSTPQQSSPPKSINILDHVMDIVEEQSAQESLRGDSSTEDVDQSSGSIGREDSTK
eukprot:9594907-Heterocapsa_arctica.AAC.1